MKDWIDGGSFLEYTLRYGHVAQSGVPAPGHPIVAESGYLLLPGDAGSEG